MLYLCASTHNQTPAGAVPFVIIPFASICPIRDKKETARDFRHGLLGQSAGGYLQYALTI